MVDLVAEGPRVIGARVAADAHAARGDLGHDPQASKQSREHAVRRISVVAIAACCHGPTVIKATHAPATAARGNVRRHQFPAHHGRCHAEDARERIAVIVLAALAMSAAAQPKYVLRFSSPNSKEHAWGRSAEKFSSWWRGDEGQVEVQVYHSNALGAHARGASR